MKKYTVEVLLKDSSTPHHYTGIDSVHEEYNYTVLYRGDGIVYRFPTAVIFRLKLIAELAKEENK